jgi:DNA-3-methyladenine glycosylase I
LSDTVANRCGWAGSDPVYVAYHDTEWGRPVTDNRRLFEKLCLEGFQAGLSWLTILRKRDHFREVFADFEPETVAALTSKDVDRLAGDAGIVRNRSKIEATIGNARAVLELGSFSDLVWGFAPEPGAAPRTLEDVPAQTAESRELSSDLKRRGFRYVGPTICYAFMQSMGLVNDHVADCHFRDAG